MSDTIEIRGLRVLAIHGVLAHEQQRAQPFEIDLDIHTDTARPASTDDLADAVDYGDVVARVAKLVAEESHNLLETLAGSVAAVILDDVRVTSVSVGVRKLRPPTPFDVDTIGVRITRHQMPRAGG